MRNCGTIIWTAMRDDDALTLAADYNGGFLSALVGDGRPLLVLFAVGLVVSGLFALFLSATVTFLPQDIAFLGMDPQTLGGMHHQRIVHFMFHDRVSFGGTLIAVGTLYLWLLAFPLGLRGIGVWVGLAVGLATVATLLLARWRLRGRLGLLPV